MSEAKKPRTAQPGDLLSQWWTLGAIAADRRTTGRHMKAGWVIINAYWEKYGNGRASLRYIEKATGLDRKAIGKACRELADWGHVTRIPHQGSRPSAYIPRWVTTVSGVEMTTTSDDAPSGVEMTPTVVAESIPLDGVSGVEMTPESYLLRPAYKPSLQIGRDETAPATPPHAAGLSAASGEAPVEEEERALAKPTFELCWRTYDYPRGKKEARAAWNALPPETDLAAVIEAAAAWQQSWAAQGKPDAPRFTLARWLKDERYDEDAPTGFQKVERPVKVSKSHLETKPRKAKATHAFAEGETLLTIIKADVVEGAASSTLAIVATDEAGVEYTHTTFLEHHNPDSQEAGQRELGDIVRAAGLGQIEDSKELLGLEIVAAVEDGKLKFTAPLVRKPQPEPPPTRSTPTLEEINARAKADFDAWCEAEHEEAA